MTEARPGTDGAEPLDSPQFVEHPSEVRSERLELASMERGQAFDDRRALIGQRDESSPVVIGIVHRLHETLGDCSID